MVGPDVVGVGGVVPGADVDVVDVAAVVVVVAIEVGGVEVVEARGMVSSPCLSLEQAASTTNAVAATARRSTAPGRT